MAKAASPSLGSVYLDRDARQSGRKVKVVKTNKKERSALCENLKSGKHTRISFETLNSRFDHVTG